MTRNDYRKLFPEWECIDNGDPFIREINKADEIIDDHLYNYELLGLGEAEARVVVNEVRALLDEYELEILNRWILL